MLPQSLKLQKSQILVFVQWDGKTAAPASFLCMAPPLLGSMALSLPRLSAGEALTGLRDGLSRQLVTACLLALDTTSLQTQQTIALLSPWGRL